MIINLGFFYLPPSSSFFFKWLSTLFSSWLPGADPHSPPQLNYIKKNTLKCEFINLFSEVNHQAAHLLRDTKQSAWTQLVFQRPVYKPTKLTSATTFCRRSRTGDSGAAAGIWEMLFFTHDLPLKPWEHPCCWPLLIFLSFLRDVLDIHHTGKKVGYVEWCLRTITLENHCQFNKPISSHSSNAKTNEIPNNYTGVGIDTFPPTWSMSQW